MLSIRQMSLAALLLGGVGCASVRPVLQPSQFFNQAKKPDIVVVTYKDNSQVPVAKPSMSGDTLVGTWAGLGEPVAVRLNELQRIDARQRSVARTTVLVVGIVGLTAASVYTIRKVATAGGRVCDYANGGPGDNCIGEGWDGPGPRVAFPY